MMNGFKQSLDGAWTLYYLPWEEASALPASPSVEAMRKHGAPAVPAQVPCSVELPLMQAGVIADPFTGTNALDTQNYELHHYWFFREFEYGEEPGGEELLFEGIDTLSEIWLNGEKIGETDNMLIPHHMPAAGLRKGKNELFVHIRPVRAEAAGYDYPVGATCGVYNHDSLHIRKGAGMYGWDILPRILSAGLWRSVSLLREPSVRFSQTYLVTDWLEEDTAGYSFFYELETDDLTYKDCYVHIRGRCGDHQFEKRQRLWSKFNFMQGKIENAKLWWPKGRGAQNLYDIEVTLEQGEKILAQSYFRTGLRKVELLRSSSTDEAGSGEFCFKVNNERFFAMGTNWVPLDAIPSRSDARVAECLALAEDIGCNIIRCWGGGWYEDDAFYDLCDEKGLLVWQDFALACAIYPRTKEYAARFEVEVKSVIRRLRQHPCLLLWCGDNESDMCNYWTWRPHHRDPNRNILTREVIPQTLDMEDFARPYLPSSPYIDEECVKSEVPHPPEDHLWGPRDYYKSDFYKNAICHFVSETGYHGCPSPASINQFISPENLWPADNDEWIVHAAAPETDRNSGCAYRIPLMFKQVDVLFRDAAETLAQFALASQISQGEAFKYFIERTRMRKWRMTGIIWWNLIDGWPQFSDAVVDYYYGKKAAYHYIKRSQQPVCLLMSESEADGTIAVYGINDTREEASISYTVRGLWTGFSAVSGKAVLPADASTRLLTITPGGEQELFILEWKKEDGGESGKNHYLHGSPTFDFDAYVKAMQEEELLLTEGFC